MATQSSVRYRQWGIYKVAYDKPPQWYFSLGYGLRTVFVILGEDAPFAARLLKELFAMAPLALFVYILGHLWMTISPPLSLYLSSTILITVSRDLSLHSLDYSPSTDRKQRERPKN
jgi:hypothetical protein